MKRRSIFSNLAICLLISGLISCHKKPDKNAAATLGGGTTNAGHPTLQLAVGTNHTCVSNGSTVKCFGKNDIGQLGRGKKSTTPVNADYSPAGVNGIEASGGPVSRIVAGTDHSCVLQGPKVKCWGSSAYGKTGLSGDRTVPAIVDAFTAQTTNLFAGSTSTCIFYGTVSGSTVTSNRVQCFGDSSYGQLSYSSLSDVTTLSLGESHSCMIKDSGIKCVGKNDLGQLGNETNISSSSLSGVVTMERAASATMVSVGFSHTCAIAYGKLYCWGEGMSGQLGLSNTDSQNIPNEVNFSGDPVWVSAGNQYTCALSSSGQLYCWGKNDKGQLGDGTTTDRLSPTLVSQITGVDSVMASVAGGHTCATSGSTLYCWGSNAYGQLGQGGTADLNVPAKVTTGF